MDYTDRNKHIRQLYVQGLTMAVIAKQFGLTAPRIMQILRQSGKMKKNRSNGRTKFTGIHLTPGVKLAVEHEAKGEETSVSAFIAQAVVEELHRRGVTIVEPLPNEVDIPLPLED